jgi:hypothetical protein
MIETACTMPSLREPASRSMSSQFSSMSLVGVPQERAQRVRRASYMKHRTEDLK